MTGLVVELCGLPGSGKTAVARHARATLAQRGVTATVADRPISAAVPRTARMLRRTALSARAVASRPRWALAACTDIATVTQPSRRDTASMIAQWLAVCDLSARSHRSAGVHLLEEGLVQTTWTLRLRSDVVPPPRLWASLPAALKSDLVVLVDVPVATAQGRLERRASRHSRSQMLPAAKLRAELERGRELLGELTSAAPVPVVRLRGSNATSAVALGAELAEHVLAHAPDLVL